MEHLKFLTEEKAIEIADNYPSPAYVYDKNSLIAHAKAALAFPNSFGLTVRYAMKASSNKNILKLFDSLGIHIDASSAFEAQRAIMAGIAPEKISISSQQMPENIVELINMGVKFNACSLYQLECYGKLLPNTELGVRINPGLGSGGTKRTNVGGPASSFGIWHEFIPQIFEICKKYNLKITKIHTHIGSGSDPEVWLKVAKMSLSTVEIFKDATCLDMGGGFKVARMLGEKTTDLQKIGAPVADEIRKFAERTGRKIKFEIEPGTFLLANCAALVCKVQDMCSTGKDGYEFIKTNSGMTDVLRPSIYGAQHPIVVVQRNKCPETKDYIVVGHCCESGDILTPLPNDPEGLMPRTLAKAEIGDVCVIEGCGAYCSSMATKNYNSYPAAPELMLEENGTIRVIRKLQTLSEIVADEI